MKKEHLLLFVCLLLWGLLPHSINAQTEDPCLLVQPARADYEVVVDTTAEKMLHPFLFEGCTFEENGTAKFMYPFPVPYNSTDFILVKAHQDGQIEWTMSYGDQNFKDAASNVKPTADGKFIVAGVSESIHNNKNYPFLMKVGPAGNIIWQRSYPNNHNLGRVQVAQLSNGNFALCSYHNPWKYSETHEMVIILTDSTGNIIKYNQFGNNGRSWDHLRGITPTSGGGFAVCGSNGHAGDYVGGLVMKFDGSGNKIWEKVWQLNNITGIWNLNSSNPNNRSRMFFTDIVESGPNLYVAGMIDNAKANGQGSTWRKGFLAEVLPSGINGWTFAYHLDSTLSVLYSLDVTSDGGFAAVGKTRENGQQKTWLLKTDMMGIPQFSHTYGGGNLDFGSWIEEGNGDSLIITGFNRLTNSNLDYRAYHTRTDPLGKGDNLCRDTAAISFRHHPHHPLDRTYSDNIYTPQDLCDLQNVEVCMEMWDCDMPMGKLAQPGLENTLDQPLWDIYPNPGRDQLFVRSSSGESIQGQIEIMDLTGRVLRRKHHHEGTSMLDVSDLSPGVYFIMIRTEAGKETLRWVKS